MNTYAGRYPQENGVVEQYTSFVLAYPNCFERSLGVGHVTGSAWLVNTDRTHVLLTHHRKLDKWLQLGGHADGNPDVLAVSMREAEEESGLICHPLSPDLFDVDIHVIPERKGEAEHLHYDCRFVLEAQSDAYTISDESHDLAWVRIDEIEQYTTEPSMLRMAQKWTRSVRRLVVRHKS